MVSLKPRYQILRKTNLNALVSEVSIINSIF